MDKGQRTLVTTLTKKMAEDLTDYLLEMGFRVRYLHSEVDTIERIRTVRELRLGEVDVLVGINLLREGLDLPEVTLVAILDADKEGFLRGETALIQTIGRAARNVEGRVIMYADKRTAAMDRAISETDRRRAAQLAFNEAHGIEPRTIVKGVSDIAELLGISGTVPYKERRKTARGRGDVGRRDGAAHGHARGGDVPGRRGASFRVRRQAARRDQGPGARPGPAAGRWQQRHSRRRCSGQRRRAQRHARPLRPSPLEARSRRHAGRRWAGYSTLTVFTSGRSAIMAHAFCGVSPRGSFKRRCNVSVASSPGLTAISLTSMFDCCRTVTSSMSGA